jgi:hypothetical protein
MRAKMKDNEPCLISDIRIVNAEDEASISRMLNEVEASVDKEVGLENVEIEFEIERRYLRNLNRPKFAETD